MSLDLVTRTSSIITTRSLTLLMSWKIRIHPSWPLVPTNVSTQSEKNKHNKNNSHKIICLLLSQGWGGQLQWVLLCGDVGPAGGLDHGLHCSLLDLTGKIRAKCDNRPRVSSDGFLTSYWPQNYSRYLLPNFDWHVFCKSLQKYFSNISNKRTTQLL